MADKFTGKLEQVDASRWRVPKGSQPHMRVDGLIFSNSDLIDDVISGGGLKQVANVASLPGIVGASMAMPDIHWGYGFPIGGVAATDIDNGGVISPGGVGYDINCGVRLLRSNLDAADIRPHAAKLIEHLFADIPAGVGVSGPFTFSGKEMRKILSRGVGHLVSCGLASAGDADVTESSGCLDGADAGAVSPQAIKRGADQCGTLGAGNHFVEIQYVDEVYDTRAASAMGMQMGQVTVMIHSGSRGLGHQVCGDYLKVLRSAPGKYGIELPDRQLVCAPVSSSEGQQYLAAMRAAANFAWCNRQLLASQVRKSLSRFFSPGDTDARLTQIYDVAHNIAKIETHVVAGKPRKLCVHRKGATRAFGPGHRELPAHLRSLGQPVLIPGDMGTASYLLLGTQTAMDQSFGSACHGAGRVMSRKQAIRHAKGRRIDAELARKGITARARGRTGLAEEQPDAYKDIDAVVECVCSAGLAKKVLRLKPMGVIKG
jgi:tRNA-splicing ligase RtcB (3'-phosphate/5'-hydroxy nucleic acid ligase)